MSCYIRHMKGFLNDLEIQTETKEERKEIDLAIREIIGKTQGDKCNEVWREVKVWMQDEDKQEELKNKLKNS
jgi:hypothetical protein